MKYKLVNENFKENYGVNLLKARGIKDVELFLNPNEECIQAPHYLDNIKEGAQYLLNNLSKNILIVVDCDCDGFTSAAIIYTYIKKIQPEADIDYIIHEGKQHGLEDCIDYILNNEKKYEVVILPDSSSNDFEYHEQLKAQEIGVLVLDHHIVDSQISDNAIVINNQTSPNYHNKDLTGAGVVYQFCRFMDGLLDCNYSKDLIDLAALGIIGDMGSMLSLENRYISKAGLEHITNPFLKVLVEKQSFAMQNKVNAETVAFYIVPLINAMIRIGKHEEKLRLFEAFIDGNKMVVSNKRGAKGTMEFLSLESYRECTNAKNHQTKIRDEAVEKLEMKIFKRDLLENKVLFIRLDEEDSFPSELNGLIAMQLSAKFKRPTIVARINSEGFVRGSARGLNKSELDNFKEFLIESGFFEYAQGHANAFGCSIPNKNLGDFHKYANEKLENINFAEDFYEVNFVRNAADKDLCDLIFDIGKYENIWGQQNECPLILITDIFLSQSDIQVIGKNSDTVRFEKNGITFIQFHAKELIAELQQYGLAKVNIIGKANINNWNGRITPQCIISSYEVTDGQYAF